MLGHCYGVSEEHHGPVGGKAQPDGGAMGATSKSIPWFLQDKACISVSTIDRPFGYHLKDEVYTKLKVSLGDISITASQLKPVD